MMELISSITGLATMSFAHIFSWHSLEEEKINYKDYKLYITLFIYIICSMVMLFFVDKFFKIVGVTMISMLLNYYLMRKSVKKAIAMVVITQIIIMFAEVLLALLFTFLHVDVNSIADQVYGGFAMDTSVSILVILISMTGYLPKLYKFVIKQVDKISSEYFMFLSFISILIANVLAMTVYYKIDFNNLLLFNSFVTIVYFLIIVHSFKNRNNFLKVTDKYNTTLSSLKEYEDILNKYRVSNHENKNQLLTIRNMVKNKDKNICEYIDTIVENKLKDNEKLMGQSMIIPEGGLRGLIYTKMLLMQEKNIQFDLSVDKAIRTMDLINIGEKNIMDICRIIGVFLDNAIEAVENLEEKFIDLEMSIEKNKLYIAITNNFIGSLDIEKIEDLGFSTKGKGHGYGLTLVKQIVDSNSLLKNEKRISSDEFTQSLIINVSKIK